MNAVEKHLQKQPVFNAGFFAKKPSLLAVISGLFLWSIIAPTQAANTPEQQRVIDAIQAEKTVFEAVWFNPQYLKLTRHKTPTKQDGFAQYICTVIAETGYKGRYIDVEIIDVLPLVQRKQWNVIGKARCTQHPRQ